MSETYTCGISPHELRVTLGNEGNVILLDMPLGSNWHAHTRDGKLMETVAFDIMRCVKHLLIMPNTGPIRTIQDVKQYYRKLIRLRDKFGLETEITMTLYFTDMLTPDVIAKLAQLPFRCEVKYYPPEKGMTTGSGHGISLHAGAHIIRSLYEHDIPLLIHGESKYDRNGNELPHDKREGYFYQNDFQEFRDAHPDNRVCLEHLSTCIGVVVVKSDTSGNTVCTITPHHLLFTLPELLLKSWRNLGRCMPYLKLEDDRAALRAFAFSGDFRAIAGDDTAPHPAYKKTGGFGIPNYPRRRNRVVFEDAACGCWLPGPHSVGLYTLAAQLCGALDARFVKFLCLNGAAWRNLELPREDERMRIVACDPPKDIPDPLPIKGEKDFVIPLGWSTEADRLKIGHALLDQMHC